jgi:putative effector of murein hydrolase
VLAGRSFEDYRPAHDLFAWCLGPVTVALAVPVYKQRGRLRAAALPLACRVALGGASTIAAVLALAVLAQVDGGVLPALAVKSVTAPIAIELAKLQGGDPALAATFAILTGTLGAMFGPALLTRCRVTDPVARGIALGTTSHGQGTAAALLESEAAGALSSLAMASAAVFTATVAPAYIPAPATAAYAVGCPPCGVTRMAHVSPAQLLPRSACIVHEVGIRLAPPDAQPIGPGHRAMTEIGSLTPSGCISGSNTSRHGTPSGTLRCTARAV